MHAGVSRSYVKTTLEVDILPQPDDTTCGPTCLHAVYRYFGHSLPLPDLIRQVPTVRGGGTLGVYLATHALTLGFSAVIYTYNLTIFDPTWFEPPLPDLVAKLRAQAATRRGERIRTASQAYASYLEAGGKVRMVDLTARLLRNYLNRGIPMITGLSSTYLYRTMREYGDDMQDDDIRGEPSGHFVVLHGYDRVNRTVDVADPFHRNPIARDHRYSVGIDRVMNAILLGIVTDDANLVILEPPHPTPKN